MAYVDQTKKAKIAAALKAVVPSNWKYTLAVSNHSTICFNLREAPVDFLGYLQQANDKNAQRRGDVSYKVGTYCDLNPYHYDAHLEFAPDDVRQTVAKIFQSLNTDNFDNSDIQTDYFNVGHYVRFNIGRWDKPFQHTQQIKEAA